MANRVGHTTGRRLITTLRQGPLVDSHHEAGLLESGKLTLGVDRLVMFIHPLAWVANVTFLRIVASQEDVKHPRNEWPQVEGGRLFLLDAIVSLSVLHFSLSCVTSKWGCFRVSVQQRLVTNIACRILR